MFHHRPAMKFCLPLIAGILIGWNCPVSPVVAAAVSLGCLLSVKFFGESFTAPLVFTSILSLGILEITVEGRTAGFDAIDAFARPGRNVTLYGQVSDDPANTTSSVRFIVDADSVETG